MNRNIPKQDVLNLLSIEKIVGIVRLKSSNGLLNVAKALYSGGIKFLEITLTMPGAIEAIELLSREMQGQVVIGAGTVLTRADAELSAKAGASFLVAPIFNPQVVSFANDANIAVMPGAITPNEIWSAWEAGADIVKIFPSSLVGPQYFSDLKSPFPNVRLMPTGNVNYKTALQYLRAGAFAIGAGTAMIKPASVYESNFKEIEEASRRMKDLVSHEET